jgi:hypothetical protein
MNRAAIAALMLCLVGCGERSLGLQLEVAQGCAVSVAKGGSVLYEVLITSPDGIVSSVCGACLDPSAALMSGTALIDFLRTAAPACHNVQPESLLTVRVVGWSVPACPAGSSSMALCAESAPQTAPDGHSDIDSPTTLKCSSACQACVPLTCASQNRSCGTMADGCNHTLDCGTCRGNQTCETSGDAVSCVNKNGP